MQFQFTTFNASPIGRRALEDIISNICRQLDALGHSGFWYDDEISLEDDTYVVVFEGFLPAHIEFLRDCQKDGAKIIIVATETPSAKGMNQGLTHELMVRQQTFPAAARTARAIWCTVRGTESWYGKFGVPATYLELGYAPGSVRRAEIALDHDFGFFGSMTRRRKKILAELAQATVDGRKALVRYTEMIDGRTRDEQMSRARVVLQIRPHDKMAMLSTSRCCTALHIGRPVIAEAHANPGVWREIIEFAHPDQFIDRAIEMSGRWRETYAAQFERFKQLLPPENCVGRAIKDTLTH